MSIEQVEIDFLLLADKAEILNGKIYMMGGGWDRRYISNLSAPVEITILLGILVPWTLTNEKHSFEIRLEDADGNALPPVVGGEITIGRPPDATRGQQFRAMASLSGRWTLPQFGTYSIVALLEGEEKKRAVFYAVQAAPRPAVVRGTEDQQGGGL